MPVSPENHRPPISMDRPLSVQIYGAEPAEMMVALDLRTVALHRRSPVQRVNLSRIVRFRVHALCMRRA